MLKTEVEKNQTKKTKAEENRQEATRRVKKAKQALAKYEFLAGKREEGAKLTDEASILGDFDFVYQSISRSLKVATDWHNSFEAAYMLAELYYKILKGFYPAPKSLKDFNQECPKELALYLSKAIYLANLPDDKIVTCERNAAEVIKLVSDLFIKAFKPNIRIAENVIATWSVLERKLKVVSVLLLSEIKIKENNVNLKRQGAIALVEILNTDLFIKLKPEHVKFLQFLGNKVIELLAGFSIEYEENYLVKRAKSTISDSSSGKNKGKEIDSRTQSTDVFTELSSKASEILINKNWLDYYLLLIQLYVAQYQFLGGNRSIEKSEVYLFKALEGITKVVRLQSRSPRSTSKKTTLVQAKEEALVTLRKLMMGLTTIYFRQSARVRNKLTKPTVNFLSRFMDYSDDNKDVEKRINVYISMLKRETEAKQRIDKLRNSCAIMTEKKDAEAIKNFDDERKLLRKLAHNNSLLACSEIIGIHENIITVQPDKEAGTRQHYIYLLLMKFFALFTEKVQVYYDTGFVDQELENTINKIRSQIKLIEYEDINSITKIFPNSYKAVLYYFLAESYLANGSPGISGDVSDLQIVTWLTETIILFKESKKEDGLDGIKEYIENSVVELIKNKFCDSQDDQINFLLGEYFYALECENGNQISNGDEYYIFLSLEYFARAYFLASNSAAYQQSCAKQCIDYLSKILKKIDVMSRSRFLQGLTQELHSLINLLVLNNQVNESINVNSSLILSDLEAQAKVVTRLENSKYKSALTEMVREIREKIPKKAKNRRRGSRRAFTKKKNTGRQRRRTRPKRQQRNQKPKGSQNRKGKRKQGENKQKQGRIKKTQVKNTKKTDRLKKTICGDRKLDNYLKKIDLSVRQYKAKNKGGEQAQLCFAKARANIDEVFNFKPSDFKSKSNKAALIKAKQYAEQKFKELMQSNKAVIANWDLFFSTYQKDNQAQFAIIDLDRCIKKIIPGSIVLPQCEETPFNEIFKLAYEQDSLIACLKCIKVIGKNDSIIKDESGYWILFFLVKSVCLLHTAGTRLFHTETWCDLELQKIMGFIFEQLAKMQFNEVQSVIERLPATFKAVLCFFTAKHYLENNTRSETQISEQHQKEQRQLVNYLIQAIRLVREIKPQDQYYPVRSRNINDMEGILKHDFGHNEDHKINLVLGKYFYHRYNHNQDPALKNGYMYLTLHYLSRACYLIDNSKEKSRELNQCKQESEKHLKDFIGKIDPKDLRIQQNKLPENLRGYMVPLNKKEKGKQRFNVQEVLGMFIQFSDREAKVETTPAVEKKEAAAACATALLNSLKSDTLLKLGEIARQQNSLDYYITQHSAFIHKYNSAATENSRNEFLFEILNLIAKVYYLREKKLKWKTDNITLENAKEVVTHNFVVLMHINYEIVDQNKNKLSENAKKMVKKFMFIHNQKRAAKILCANIKKCLPSTEHDPKTSDNQVNNPKDLIENTWKIAVEKDSLPLCLECLSVYQQGNISAYFKKDILLYRRLYLSIKILCLSNSQDAQLYYCIEEQKGILTRAKNVIQFRLKKVKYEEVDDIAINLSEHSKNTTIFPVILYYFVAVKYLEDNPRRAVGLLVETADKIQSMIDQERYYETKIYIEISINLALQDFFKNNQDPVVNYFIGNYFYKKCINLIKSNSNCESEYLYSSLLYLAKSYNLAIKSIEPAKPTNAFFKPEEKNSKHIGFHKKQTAHYLTTLMDKITAQELNQVIEKMPGDLQTILKSLISEYHEFQNYVQRIPLPPEEKTTKNQDQVKGCSY